MNFTDATKLVKQAKEKTIRFTFGDDYDLVVDGEKVTSLEGQWIDLNPLMSKAYSDHKLEINRKYAEIKDKPLDGEIETEILAGLIKDWSFADECTQENKIAILKEFDKQFEAALVMKANNVNFTKSKRKG